MEDGDGKTEMDMEEMVDPGSWFESFFNLFRRISLHQLVLLALIPSILGTVLIYP